MKPTAINDELFKHAFISALIIGTMCRLLVLRVIDKQYPTRPLDYIEQVIVAGLSASLGAIAFPALIDKEFSALTFFAVAIQQFQGLSQQEAITLDNLDNDEVVPKGECYVEEIAATYESRSYISLFSALAASVAYIFFARRYKLGVVGCNIIAIISGGIVGLIFRYTLKRKSIGDFADVVPAKLEFKDTNLEVNGVYINNIGLKATRDRYMKKGMAVEIIPKDIASFGIINDLGQRQAILHNIFIHMGIDKDIDEVDILTIAKVDLDRKSIVIPITPILQDMDVLIDVIKSTPVLETSKNKQSAYKKKPLFFK